MGTKKKIKKKEIKKENKMKWIGKYAGTPNTQNKNTST